MGASPRTAPLAALLAVVVCLGAQARVVEPVLSTLSPVSDAIFDGAGNLYVLAGNTGYKIDPAGAVSVFIDATGDGAGNALDCSSFACRLTGDAAGTLYVNDDFPTSTVFRVTPAGVVTKIIDASGDGLGNTLDGSWAVPGPAGDVYVTGRRTDNVFHVDAAGVITEIIDATGDGAGNTLASPPAFGPAVAADGTAYVSGGLSHNVFKVEPGGAVTEIIDATGDGAGNVLSEPHAPHVDAAGNVFVVGRDSRNAFKVEPGGTIIEIIDETGDGAGHALVDPQHNFLDALGNFHVASLDDATNEVSLFRITPGGAVTRVLSEGGDGGTHPVPRIRGAGADGSGGVYVATISHVSNPDAQPAVLKITPGGGIVPVLDGSEMAPAGGLLGVAADGTLAALASDPIQFFATRVLRIRFGCTPAPQSGCRRPTVSGASLLQVKNLSADTRDLVKLKWVRGQETTLADLGDPTSAEDYEVCLYESSAVPATVLFETTAPAGGSCGGQPCWRSLGTKGFRYAGKGTAPSGLRKLVLKAGEEGRAKVVASGRGAALKPMALPLALPVTVQVQAANGECWEATFDAGGIKKSDAVQFKGVSD